MQKNNSAPTEKIEVRWADVDQNQHVRHSAYYDYGAHMRLRYFKKLGFGVEEFRSLKIGPILFHEECHFIRELYLNDTVNINILRGDIRPDGSRWVLYHEIYNNHGVKSAQIKISGAWMDIVKRKLTVPPAEIAEAFMSLPMGEDFVYKKR